MFFSEKQLSADRYNVHFILFDNLNIEIVKSDLLDFPGNLGTEILNFDL